MTDFAKTRELFYLPDGVIYLDGNSLGPLPHAAKSHLPSVLQDEWGEMLIRGWNQARWFVQPSKVGDRIAKLVGAEPGSITTGDTLSIRIYQALDAALSLTPERRVILSDSGNFPTDLYMASGLTRRLDKGYEIRTVAPEEVENAIAEDVAVLMLTEVDYRTGRLHDMKRLTEKAHAVGALTVWDLAHSAGALPIDLAGAGADFAAGCTYKYLNGGPGAPAFIYVAPKHLEKVQPALSGWMGHKSPFDFTLDYKPADGIERMRIGTPPVLALAVLEKALDAWDGVSLADVRAKSIELGDLFIQEVEARCPQLELFSPREGAERGSQVSFLFDEGYAAMQALIDRGVIGDFRAPNAMRFGFTPLYIDEKDVRDAVDILDNILRNRLWDQPKYKQRAAVT